MSPLQLARAVCANAINDHHLNEGVCVLQKRGARCAYFERCVLPLARMRPDLYPQVEAQYWERAASAQGVPPAAVAQFQAASEQSKVRCCQDCGAALRPQQRYCQACLRRSRRCREKTASRMLPTFDLRRDDAPQTR
jgi:hypothetical protein